MLIPTYLLYAVFSEVFELEIVPLTLDYVHAGSCAVHCGAELRIITLLADMQDTQWIVVRLHSKLPQKRI